MRRKKLYFLTLLALAFFVKTNPSVAADQSDEYVNPQEFTKKFEGNFVIDVLDHGELFHIVPEGQLEPMGQYVNFLKNAKKTWQYLTSNALGISLKDIYQIPLGSGQKDKDVDGIRFDVTKVKVGDKIGALQVNSVSPDSDNYPISANNAKVFFTGELTLTGYYLHQGPGLFGNAVIFTSFTTDSKQKLPLINGNEQFYFANQDEAIKEFGPVGSVGIATIVINNYQLRSCACETYNGFTLVRVVKKDEMADVTKNTLGKILLSTEGHGELWYVNPSDGKRYYLPSPKKTFRRLAKLAVAIPEEYSKQIWSEAWKIYTNSEYGFVFWYPAQWKFSTYDSEGTNHQSIARVVNPDHAGVPETDQPTERFLVSSKNLNCEGQSINLGGKTGTGNPWALGFGQIYWRDLCFETQDWSITITLSAFDESGKTLQDKMLATFKFTN